MSDGFKGMKGFGDRVGNTYHVVLIDDEETPITLLMDVLTKQFKKNAKEAANIITEMGSKGEATVATFTHDIADTYKRKAEKFAADENAKINIKLKPVVQ